MFALRDIEGFVEGQLLLSPAAFFVATCLDGENDVLDIQYAFAREFDGQTPEEEDILRIVDVLEQNGFLEGDRFSAIRDDILGQFSASDTRPAWLAGKSYPADPGELREYLDGFFVGSGLPEKGLAKSGPPLRALVVPHIDLDRGGHVYAKGYARLAQHGRPHTVMIFGVAIPNAWARYGGDAFLATVLPTLVVLQKVLLPLVSLQHGVNWIARRLAGIPDDSDVQDEAEEIEKEILGVVSEGEATGAVHEKYASMILINAPSFGINPPRYYYPGEPIHVFMGIKLLF